MSMYPAGHSVHFVTPLAEYEPALHFVHGVAALESRSAVPLAHAVQAVAPVADEAPHAQQACAALTPLAFASLLANAHGRLPGFEPPHLAHEFPFASLHPGLSAQPFLV
jgi:hypothetical protein